MKVDFPEPDGPMTASVKVETNARADVLLAPNAALRWRPAGTAASGSAVWVLGPDGEPRMVPVRIGLGDTNVTEISSTEGVREVIIGRSQ